ncbi:MAG: PA2778 family cysteine peptidase [Betaproteobacteria bacterium]|nr:PA2778 family cysteine peptidase [Betaproteobacteria bacterium]
MPFFPQEQYQCGPATLATTLRFSGADVTPDALVPQVYTPGLKGSLQLDLVGAARRAGRIPYRIAPTLTALFEELSAGNPVLVLQDLGLLTQEWHYAVAVGYDRDTEMITLQSGDLPALQMSWARFDKTWISGKRWGIVTLTPDRIPASATEEEYLKQVAALDSVSSGLAGIAYQTSLTRWPDSLVALMGLGNLAYAAGRYDQAVKYFLQASTAHPNAGDAFNNLAQTYLRQGQRGLAYTVIERALALGGSHVSIYRKTRDEVEAEASQP